MMARQLRAFNINLILYLVFSYFRIPYKRDRGSIADVETEL